MALAPDAVFSAALDSPTAAAWSARAQDGSMLPLPVDRWLGSVTGADRRLLARATGPVLDVGCGPGRHVHALAVRGVAALGVDVSGVAVRLARRRGARVLESSIFDRIPGAGTWRTALLLDGNIGIGGSPAAVLGRIADLLHPAGSVLVETDPPGTGLVDLRMRLEGGDTVSDWFDWARVGCDVLDQPASGAGLQVVERWDDEQRWFARLVLA